MKEDLVQVLLLLKMFMVVKSNEGGECQCYFILHLSFLMFDINNSNSNSNNNNDNDNDNIVVVVFVVMEHRVSSSSINSSRSMNISGNSIEDHNGWSYILYMH